MGGGMSSQSILLVCWWLLKFSTAYEKYIVSGVTVAILYTIIQGAYSSIRIMNSDLVLKGWNSHIVKLTLWGCGNTEGGLATGPAACCVGGGAAIKTSVLFQHLSNEQCACHIWHIKPCSTSVQSSQAFEPGDLWPWQRPLCSAPEECHLSCWDLKVFRHFHDVSNNCNAYKSERACSLIGLSLSNAFYMKHTRLYTFVIKIPQRCVFCPYSINILACVHTVITAELTLAEECCIPQWSIATNDWRLGTPGLGNAVLSDRSNLSQRCTLCLLSIGLK